MTGRAGLGAAEPSGIGEMLVSSRSFDEYRSMFRLSEDDLRLRILDCPGGASGFTAAAVAAGAPAQACDPLYGRDLQELTSITLANRRRAEHYVRAHPEEYEWSYFDGPADYLEQRGKSADAFLEDYGAHPWRYVAASLPALPFADDSFDLALCSHLLFAYADRLDLAFHVDAIRELARVSTMEVRIFPVFTMGSAPLLDLDPLTTALADCGISTTRVRVDYRFQRGEPVMLICRSGAAR